MCVGSAQNASACPNPSARLDGRGHGCNPLADPYSDPGELCNAQPLVKTLLEILSTDIHRYIVIVIVIGLAFVAAIFMLLERSALAKPMMGQDVFLFVRLPFLGGDAEDVTDDFSLVPGGASSANEFWERFHFYFSLLIIIFML
eukprot:SAG11_NODE_5142_length_1652_cov_1.830650_3_plen_143_part_01